jgi:hypothetical protein
VRVTDYVHLVVNKHIGYSQYLQDKMVVVVVMIVAFVKEASW